MRKGVGELECACLHLGGGSKNRSKCPTAVRFSSVNVSSPSCSPHRHVPIHQLCSSPLSPHLAASFKLFLLLLL